jgi:hypothetical protein
VTFELPAGQAQINVTRGSNVQFISNSRTRIEAHVIPMDANGVRMTLSIAGLVIVLAAYYISRSYNHLWIGVLRSKLLTSNSKLKQIAT